MGKGKFQEVKYIAYSWSIRKSLYITEIVCHSLGQGTYEYLVLGLDQQTRLRYHKCIHVLLDNLSLKQTEKSTDVEAFSICIDGVHVLTWDMGNLHATSRL